MNRRQAMASIGVGSLAFAGEAAACGPAPVLKVSVAIPELYGLDGKLSVPPTIRKAGYGFQFCVVIQNVSAGDVLIWAEGNSEGHGTLSFEVTEADGKKTVVRRMEQDWSKNIIRAERLAPDGMQVRVVEHDPLPSKPPQWEAFPFGTKDTSREVTLRAVFEQPKADGDGKLKMWAGKVVSAPYKVALWSTS